MLLRGVGGRFRLRGGQSAETSKPFSPLDPPVCRWRDARAAALQYVRKISGFSKPSKANEAAFGVAVDEVALRRLAARIA